MIQYLSQQNPEIFHNKKVLVRLDLNVPVTDGVVTASDASRIVASLPTLQYLQNAGAMITVISHIGRSPEESLEPVVYYMRKFIDIELVPIPSPTLPEGKGATPGYLMVNSKDYKELIKRSKELKDNQTPAEEELWKLLKGDKFGEHFRRQHIIDHFIVDFVCLKKRLVIEIDGEIHNKQVDRDIERDEKLNELGFKILRFTNEQIFSTIDVVISEIKQELESRGSEVLPFGEDLGGDFDDCIILPNLRSNPGEELNDPAFAASLCQGQDYYVNDAFAVSHRAHASVVGVPTIMGHEKCFAGFQLEHEIEFLNQALSPQSPSLLIMGGAKFETKLPVIETLLPLVDHVLVGGALLNNFLKSSGVDIGDSLIDPDANIDHLVHNPKIIIPDNLVWQDNKILDIDPEYFNNSEIIEIITKAQTIIWNGPMGYYEGGFTGGTEALVTLLSESKAVKIIGGGDSVALIQQLHLTDKFDFLSTGGGAMLEYLAHHGSLPGIDVLQ